MDPSTPGRAYQEALGFLYGRINYERNTAIPYRSRDFRLDRMRQLARRIGNPEQALRIVHIAGTKGKGSTAAMIAAALQQAGLRTGLYTSPHLERLEERFVIDGRLCPEDRFVELVQILRPIVEELDDEFTRKGGRGPTFFEITTAMALRFFADAGTDAVVLEVGLGGRLDSTNICQPLVAVVTSISLDHTRQLGNTPAKIAREKAGIIKPGVPVVCGVLQPEPRDIIASIARQQAAPLFQLGQDFHCRFRPGRLWADPVSGANHRSPTNAECDLQSAAVADSLDALDYVEHVGARELTLPNLRVGLLGEHQARNAAVAVAALLRLRDAGFAIPDSAILNGLARPLCPARIEVVSRRPPVIVDVAHNVASLAALLDVVRDKFPGRRRTIIFAASQDKDVRGMLELVVPNCDQLILTRYCNNPRSATPEELHRMATEVAGSAGRAATLQLAEHPAAAWKQAETAARRGDVVCITGSFFLAAEMRPLVVQQLPRLAETDCRLAKS
jgi:dihydrofolate synthase / folylpolyglutamate synthase